MKKSCGWERQAEFTSICSSHIPFWWEFLQSRAPVISARDADGGGKKKSLQQFGKEGTDGGGGAVKMCKKISISLGTFNR